MRPLLRFYGARWDGGCPAYWEFAEGLGPAGRTWMHKHSRGLGAAREVVLHPFFFFINFLIYNVMKKKYNGDLIAISDFIRKLGVEVYGEDVFFSHPITKNEFIIDVTYLLLHYDRLFRES